MIKCISKILTGTFKIVYWFYSKIKIFLEGITTSTSHITWCLSQVFQSSWIPLSIVAFQNHCQKLNRSSGSSSIQPYHWTWETSTKIWGAYWTGWRGDGYWTSKGRFKRKLNHCSLQTKNISLPWKNNRKGTLTQLNFIMLLCLLPACRWDKNKRLNNHFSYFQQKEIAKLLKENNIEEIGPVTKGLDWVLQKFHVERQAYHSKCFIGNHVHKMLQVLFPRCLIRS